MLASHYHRLRQEARATASNRKATLNTTFNSGVDA